MCSYYEPSTHDQDTLDAAHTLTNMKSSQVTLVDPDYHSDDDPDYVPDEHDDFGLQYEDDYISDEHEDNSEVSLEGMFVKSHGKDIF